MEQLFPAALHSSEQFTSKHGCVNKVKLQHLLFQRSINRRLWQSEKFKMHHLVVELFYMKQNTHFHRWCPGKQGVLRVERRGSSKEEKKAFMVSRRWIMTVGLYASLVQNSGVCWAKIFGWAVVIIKHRVNLLSYGIGKYQGGFLDLVFFFFTKHTLPATHHEASRKLDPAEPWYCWRP